MLVSALLVGALALDPLRSCAAVEHPERYIQSRSGEIQLLPALTLEEIPRGHVSGVEAAGGFVFDLEWRENKMTKMRVFSPSGGVCRVRSYAGMGSPLLRKAKGDCPNPAIAATKAAPTDALPESCFERRKNPLSSVCFDFDTEPGETLEFKGVSGNQDWTSYAAHLSDAFLATSEAARIAQNVLDWQLKTGGWPKNVPMYEKLTPKERKAVLAMKGDRKRATIDNGATFAEMRFLARMYKATDRKEYLDGVVRGIDFLLDLQYPNGGWPQFDPSKKGYWAQITFNDGAMVNVLNLLRDVFDSRAPFDIEIPDAKRAAARDAFWKGVGCILATQVKQNGKLTVWCQQHDKETLAPCQGRAFELPALTSYESLGIVELLMSLDPADCVGKGRPDYARIEAAIEGAKEWYAKTEIRRFKFEKNYRRDDGILSRRLVPVPEAEADRLWCRYYTLDDNRPFTGTRQGEKRFTFEEMERGENMSYQWFNGSGVKMEKEYAKWLKRVEKLKDADKMQIDSGVTIRHTPQFEPATLRVAAGDSLQAVLDSIPEGSPRPYVVRVAPGRYREKVKLGGRRAKVGLVADDPAPGKTVISWNDTPSTPGPDGKGLGTSGSATMTVNIPDFTM